MHPRRLHWYRQAFLGKTSCRTIFALRCLRSIERAAASVNRGEIENHQSQLPTRDIVRPSALKRQDCPNIDRSGSFRSTPGTRLNSQTSHPSNFSPDLLYCIKDVPVIEMGVARGGLHYPMPEKLPDHRQRLPVHRCLTGECVANR